LTRRFEQIALLLALTVVLSSCAGVEVGPPAPGKGKVRGTVVAEGIAVPLEGAVVEGGGAKTTVGRDNTFAFSEIGQGKQYLVVEKKLPSGKIRRVLGVSTIFVADNPVEIRVRVRDASDVDAFCSDCHPPLKSVTRSDQKFRDIHVSGIAPKRAGKDTDLLSAEGKVTCESCHTAHRPTKYRWFGVADLKSGHFCNRCHGSR
jgi:hypothetical protein